MAVVPICYKMPYKDQAFQSHKQIRQNERGFTHRNVSRGTLYYRGSMPLDSVNEMSILSKVQKTTCHIGFGYNDGSQSKELCDVWLSSKSNPTEKQLRELDTYFGKLRRDSYQPSSDSLNKVAKTIDRSGLSKAEKWLGSLDNYLSKVNKVATSKNSASTAFDGEKTEAAAYSVSQNSVIGGGKKLSNLMKLKANEAKGGPKTSYDETADLYFIGILVSINIAVYLFEIASPIQNSDLQLFSIPLVYGAKINELILIGEWWRLVTPMFLHSGIFHVALGCWMLLTFGPRVCRVYGSFTFFLIYVIGGISGNLTSFLHTTEPTVGGTGPAFAIIGAWLIYQIQNRDVTEKDVSESMFQKAIIATALSFVLSSFGPIDDWSHFGAAFTGIVYGYFTCPTLQVDDTSLKSGQEEGITLVRRNTDPCKSLFIFSLLVLLLSSLLFVIEPPLNSLAYDSFI